MYFRKSIALAFCLLFALILLLTNPSLEAHRAEVRNVLYKREHVNPEQMQNLQSSNNWAATGILLSNYFLIETINQQVDSVISSSNYGLFSLTRYQAKARNSAVGIGLFGNVYLWEDISEVGIFTETNLTKSQCWQ